MAPLTDFGLVLFGNTLRAIGAGIGWVFSTQLLLQLVPNDVRGRVFSADFALFTLMNAAGSAVGGWTLDAGAMGLSDALWWMTALILIPGVLWTLWILRDRKQPSLALQ
jgi:predicted MFS family arabinose efflux permease